MRHEHQNYLNVLFLLQLYIENYIAIWVNISSFNLSTAETTTNFSLCKWALIFYFSSRFFSTKNKQCRFIYYLFNNQKILLTNALKYII